MRTLSVIIPVFNEITTIQEILQRVKATGLASEIVIVDDFSTDGTRQLLENYQPDLTVKILFHPKNQGKGAAVRTGIDEATSEFIVIQDADLEYDPNDYAKLFRPIENGTADVVYGSCFLIGQQKNILFLSKMANKMLTFITNLLYSNSLTDMETCYKLIPRDLLRNIPLHSHGFDFEPEITAKLLKRKARVVEVPITFHARNYEEGKKIKAKDAFIAINTLIKYRFTD
jgi:glycosyltransferase involved in cell wall biosynthesis